MKRWLPSPLLSLVLFFAWPMLNASVSVGHLLIAAALALAIPLATARWRPQPPRLGAPGVALRLARDVLVDIVRSNLVVARLILGHEARIRPRFVWMRLKIRDPHGTVALAGIITMTPGTLSADLSDDRRHLLIHAFDVADDAAAEAIVAEIRSRYETPLIRIFEGGPGR